MSSYLATFKNMFDFHGCSTSEEYWGFIGRSLVLLAVVALPGLAFGSSLENSPVFMMVMPVLLVAFSSLQVRRLHDAGYSGWWGCLWALLLPGAITLYLSSKETKELGNEYRDDYCPEGDCAGFSWVEFKRGRFYKGVVLFMFSPLLVSFAAIMLAGFLGCESRGGGFVDCRSFLGLENFVDMWLMHFAAGPTFIIGGIILAICRLTR